MDGIPVMVCNVCENFFRLERRCKIMIESTKIFTLLTIVTYYKNYFLVSLLHLRFIQSLSKSSGRILSL